MKRPRWPRTIFGLPKPLWPAIFACAEAAIWSIGSSAAAGGSKSRLADGPTVHGVACDIERYRSSRLYMMHSRAMGAKLPELSGAKQRRRLVERVN